MEDPELPITQHLEELRNCLMKAAIGIVIGFALCYVFSEEILSFFQKPLFEILPEDQRKLFFTNPLEKLMVFIKIGVAGGLALSSPWIFYQLWKFVVPALYNREKNFLLPFIILGTLLFFGGGAFCFYFVIPAGLKFLLTLGGSTDGAIITYSSYLDVVLVMMIVMGCVFQVPLLMGLAVATGLVEVERLRRLRPQYYIGMAVVCAAVTPPDPFSMIAMLIPAIVLYEIMLLVFKWKK